MEELLWKVIEESKEGQAFINSRKQYRNLEVILSKYDKKTVEGIYEAWRDKMTEQKTDEFEKLHIQNGGIVNSGDDGFYIDFANWLIGQGEALFNQFEIDGHKAVLTYIEENNVSEDDYLFECLGYAFLPYID